jgi:hypothetical protein
MCSVLLLCAGCDWTYRVHFRNPTPQIAEAFVNFINTVPLRCRCTNCGSSIRAEKEESCKLISPVSQDSHTS